MLDVTGRSTALIRLTGKFYQPVKNAAVPSRRLPKRDRFLTGDVLMESNHWEAASPADPDRLIMAGQIAERCCVQLVRRLNGLGADMSAAEARSYIRTRSAVVIRSETQRWLIDNRDKHLPESVLLIELATELLVDHFMSVHASSVDERHAA